MCVSRVNDKSYIGNANEIQAVCNNTKYWFFKCPRFWQFGINWILLNVNINIAHESYAKCEFKVYVSTDATVDAAPCWIFAAFILTPKDGKPKI